VTRTWLIPVLTVVVLFGGWLGPTRAELGTQTEQPAHGDTTARRAGAAVPDSAASARRAERVEVYYFHRTARCESCLKFEAYAEETLRTSFAEALADGSLEWRVVNLDDTTNTHFIDDYDLFESSLVVSGVREGVETHWRKLDAIWTLVQDEEAFLAYVADEVGEELRRLDEGRELDPGVVPVHWQLVPEPDGGGLGAPPQG
jgi:hypothetical protein